MSANRARFFFKKRPTYSLAFFSSDSTLHSFLYFRLQSPYPPSPIKYSHALYRNIDIEVIRKYY